jgi:hypothetical protein
MDFSLTEVQRMLTDSVEKFIVNDYDFESRQKYAASELGYSAEVWQTFAELGWTAVPFSEDDGGFDGGPIELMVMMQQFGRGLIVEPYLANVVLAGGVLRRVASDTQKAKWLQPLIGGELQGALAIAEPQSRYDLSNVAVTAIADGDEWIINGKKGVVLNGGNARLLIIPARTSGDSTATDGITLFAVGGSADGVTRQSYANVDGQRAAELNFQDVRVDATAVLGEVGGGYATLEAVIDEATLAICAEAVGIMQIMSEKTVEYSKSRVQFGVPISSFQALQHRMVDMLTACEQSYSLLIWAAMSNADGTDDARKSISAIKYQVGTSGQKVGQEAVQIHGAMGVTWDLDIAHYFKRLTAIGQMFGNADWHLDKLAV